METSLPHPMVEIQYFWSQYSSEHLLRSKAASKKVARPLARLSPQRQSSSLAIATALAAIVALTRPIEVSGRPAGYDMIRDFKAQIFCRQTNLSKRKIDTADRVRIDRIDAIFPADVAVAA